MGSQASAILYLPLSQEDWRGAVRSFVGAEKRNIFAIEVSVTKPAVALSRSIRGRTTSALPRIWQKE